MINSSNVGSGSLTPILAFLFPDWAAFGNSVGRTFWRSSNNHPIALCLLFLKIAANRIKIVIELLGVLVSEFARFGNDWILLH